MEELRNPEGNPPESSPPTSSSSQDGMHVNSESLSSITFDEKQEHEHRRKAIENMPTENEVEPLSRVEEIVVGPTEAHDIPSPNLLQTSKAQLSSTPQQLEGGVSIRTDDVGVNDVRASEDDIYNIVHSGETLESIDVSEHLKQVYVSRALVDTAAPFESVKEAVTKFGGILDWKAHKIQAMERRKLVECELKKAQEEIPEYKKQSEAAKDAKAQVLKELDSTKRLIEELKLNLERVQTEEKQAKQDSELAKLRVEEIGQGIGDEASVVAKAQLEVAKSRHDVAVSELKCVKDELEKLRAEYASLVVQKDMAVKRAEEAVSASKEVEKTVEELILELIMAKESLESAHAAHLEAEEQRIGAAMAREQDSLSWEKELKQVEDELQRLNQQLISNENLEEKLDTASALLVTLKDELAAYTEAKLNQESSEEPPKTSVDSVKKELEEVRRNIEKATTEVNYLKVAAVSLKSELENEKSTLVSLRQREGMASVAVSSLEAELRRISSEVAVVQMKEKDLRENIVELPKQIQKAAQEADEARSFTQLAHEDLRKAREEIELTKAGACMMERRLNAAQKEIEAAKASERLALAAIKALEGSESAEVTLSFEEYSELSKQAYKAEERAHMKVLASISQLEVVKESEVRSLEKLEATIREVDIRKESLRIAAEKAEKAKDGKLGVEQELRKWRAEHKQQRRKADDRLVNHTTTPLRNFNVGSDTSVPVPHTMSSPRLFVHSPEARVIKKKKSLFPRVIMFLARKKAGQKSL